MEGDSRMSPEGGLSNKVMLELGAEGQDRAGMGRSATRSFQAGAEMQGSCREEGREH